MTMDTLRSSVFRAANSRQHYRILSNDFCRPTSIPSTRQVRLVIQAAGYVNRGPLHWSESRRNPSLKPLSPSQRNESWRRPKSPSPNIPPQSGISSMKQNRVSVKLEQALEALVVKYRVRRTQKTQMRMFMELGLTVDDLSKLLRRRIAVLDHKPSTIKRKFKFLVDYTGISKEQLKKLFSKFPRILEYNMKKTVQPRLEFFLSIGCQKEDLVKILVNAPAVAELSVENTLAPRVKYLEETIGVKPEYLRKTILKKPQLLTSSVESMSVRVAFFQEWNLSPADITKIVTLHPQVLHYSIRSMAEHISYLLHTGVPKSSIQRILTRFPQLLGLDLRVNVAPKLKYLKGELGGTSQTLENNPVFVGLSLKKRIIPRHKFLSTLSEISVPNPVPINWFKCSDEVFANNVAKVPLEEFIAYKNTYHKE